MTIRPRHYAELLLADATPAVVASRLIELDSIAGSTRQLSQLTTNPATKVAVRTLLSELKIDELVEAIVMELAHLGRLKWLRSILRASEARLVQTGNPVPVHVMSAHPIKDTDSLKEQLIGLLGPIASLTITTNPDELGGIRVQAADRSLDTRLDHRLHQLRRMIRERNV